jgi:translation initiation factor 1
MKSKNDKNRIIYSTDPNFMPEHEVQPPIESLPAQQQKLYVRLDRLKGGKTATVVENFIAPLHEIEALGKELKTKCGVGGSVKNGEILIQGDHREKILKILTEQGFQVKKKGG